jgi:hypothetical protein
VDALDGLIDDNRAVHRAASGGKPKNKGKQRR